MLSCKRRWTTTPTITWQAFSKHGETNVCRQCVRRKAVPGVRTLLHSTL